MKGNERTEGVLIYFGCIFSEEANKELLVSHSPVVDPRKPASSCLHTLKKTAVHLSTE